MSSNAELTIDSHPSFILKFEDGEVTPVDKALLDADSEDLTLETDHESRATEDGTVHRFSVVLRDGDIGRWSADGDSEDGNNVSDDHRSWDAESDESETDDSERSVSNNHRSWGDD